MVQNCRRGGRTAARQSLIILVNLVTGKCTIMDDGGRLDGPVLTHTMNSLPN